MDNIKNYLKDFDHHRTVSFIHDPKTHLDGFIAIHRGNGNQVPAFGATRFVAYKNMLDGLQDALRLSKLMSYKSALAGLKYGGAKGVIFIPKDRYNKKLLLGAYCQKINLLNGHFITGGDVGINSSEVQKMSKDSPFIVGVKADPVEYTTLGLMYALEVCLDKIFGNKNIKGKTFSIQGVGRLAGLAHYGYIFIHLRPGVLVGTRHIGF